MAVHWATLWVLCYARSPQAAVIHYDSTSAGKPAEGLYTVGPNIEIVARAARGIVHKLEANAILLAFLHVHSHDGNPLNEPADALAKAAAKGDYFAGPPTGMPPSFMKPTTRLQIGYGSLTPPKRSKQTTASLLQKAATYHARCQITPPRSNSPN